MAVFKCKMCGADLPLIDDSTVCECEYCGTTQTVPAANNEKKMNLFNRANRLRFANEFDKAAGVFESIVSEFPEEAEAYWGLCLCKYGIEYVDDPTTAKKYPLATVQATTASSMTATLRWLRSTPTLLPERSIATRRRRSTACKSQFSK